ncbi:MAG: hypothetical protein ACPGU1_17215 [Myxococcota bacterium]
MRMSLVAALCVAMASLWVGCGGSASVTTKSSNPPPAFAEVEQSEGHTAADVRARAKAYMRRAGILEPELTKKLVSMAEARAGKMYKLQHRRKSLKSTQRKINKILTENPELRLEDIDIEDIVRYTMLLEDEPAGHHNRSVAEVLSTLEEMGHTVVQVKNYWPKGDNYSGINTVMRAPAGLTWELQFHTNASAGANTQTREMYEEMRLVTTPLARKQELFDMMSAVWESIPIPLGILTPGSLHVREVVKDRARPE